MLHNNTNIKTTITTSSTAGIDVFANFRDQNGVLRAFFEKITTATDTELEISKDTVVIDFLSIKNIHASSTNTVSLKKNNGTDTVELFKVVLSAGEVIQYEPQKGRTVFTADGKIKVQTASSTGGGSAWGDITGTLSDQTDLQSALDSKEDSITAGTTGQYWRGDKSWQTLDKTAVGLSNVDNTSDANKPVSTAQSTAISAAQTAAETYADGLIASLIDSSPLTLDTLNELAAALGDDPNFATTISTALGNRLRVDTAAQGLSSTEKTNAKTNLDLQNVVNLDTSTTANISDSTDKRFMTDAQETKLDSVEANADVTDAANVGTAIDGSTAKTTPVDADTMPLIDSAASNVLKKVTWANIKTTLKSYFDSLTTTLTNKRITKRVGTDTSSATPTINTDNVDVFKITAQAVDITSFTTNLSGTPSDFDSLTISITGTASRAITWGSSFENGAATLPTTTSGTSTLDVHFRWNSTTSKWRCMAQG